MNESRVSTGFELRWRPPLDTGCGASGWQVGNIGLTNASAEVKVIAGEVVARSPELATLAD